MSAEVIVLVVVLVSVIVAAALVTAYLTAHRLDRLHIRTDLARSSLLGALGRRHAVAVAVAGALAESEPAAAGGVSDAVARARSHPAHGVIGADPAPDPDMRRWSSAGDEQDAEPNTEAERAENDLGLVLAGLDSGALTPELARELEVVTDRVSMARRFYNDAVRDTRDLRERPVVRMLRLAGRAPMPDYVELVDAPPAGT